jgi:cysteine desulfurase/selenocysteine lyase
MSDHSMNVPRIRDDFPILKDIVYLDSAATSLTPKPVLRAILDYYYHYRANVGRGVYRLAQLADQRYRDAHRKVADFIGAQEGATIFTKNTTESINAVACGQRLKRGDKIVTTLLEHHSNLLPWMRLEKKGVELVVIKPDEEGYLDPSDFERAVDGRTKLVAVSHLSNVLGTIAPIKEISRICKERNAALLVDGAQSVPHMSVDVMSLGCDFLCFSGHKMLGPTGTGVLWIRNEENLEPLMVGGGMVEEVFLNASEIKGGRSKNNGYVRKKGYEGFEAGTPDVSGGIGLGAAADYLMRVGIEEVALHEMKLASKLLKGLQEIKGLEIYGPKDVKGRGGVISFNVSGLLPHEVALILDQASDISVRSGHHCCIPLMKHLGLKHGCVRASLYLYNTESEIEKLLSTLDEIAKVA